MRERGRLAVTVGPYVQPIISHSVLDRPAQRPSRPLPGFVQGAQPIDA